MNIDNIQENIDRLENEVTTFENCMKLASLYIVRQNINTRVDEGGNRGIQAELNDVLPEYKKYVNVKRRYQLGELSESNVEEAIKQVCQEIKEFIEVLYSNTDMEQERKAIIEMLKSLTML